MTNFTQNLIKLKSEIFTQYVKKVCELYSIPQKDFFKKVKKREVVEARFLVYYLCKVRKIDQVYVKRFMNDNGYTTPHSTISYGISVMSKKAKDDIDYANVVSQITKSVHI